MTNRSRLQLPLIAVCLLAYSHAGFAQSDEGLLHDFETSPNGTYYVAETDATSDDIAAVRAELEDEGINPDTVYPSIASEVPPPDTNAQGMPMAQAYPKNPKSDWAMRRKTFTFKVREADSAAVDGDVVQVRFNGRSLGIHTLSAAGQRFTVTMQSSRETKSFCNTITIKALSMGTQIPCTVAVDFNQNEVGVGLLSTSAFLLTDEVGTIKLNLANVFYSASKYPESTTHAEEAISRGKPVMLTFQRDAAAADSRRNASQALYLSNPNNPRAQQGVQDLDDYPPATFIENGGTADIKPIALGDNRGSGASMGIQLRPMSSDDQVEFTTVP